MTSPKKSAAFAGRLGRSVTDWMQSIIQRRVSAAGRVIGVEVVEQAVEDARDNAKRNGIENADTIEALHRMQPRRIVYISCDPATLARDVALLKERGYRVQSAMAADLFPRCAYVESVVCLVRE